MVLIVPMQRHRRLADALDDIIRAADYRDYTNQDLHDLAAFLVWYKQNEPITAAQYLRHHMGLRHWVRLAISAA